MASGSAREIPNARLVRVENASHWILAEEVAAFLAEA
jgi:pimeloyl-ACP methyl ester carboxylesterase